MGKNGASKLVAAAVAAAKPPPVSLPPLLQRVSPTAFLLHCTVKPGARTTSIVAFTPEALELRLAAPPVDGKANEELVRFLEDDVFRKLTRVKRVTIARGHTSRDKAVQLEFDGEATALIDAMQAAAAEE